MAKIGLTELILNLQASSCWLFLVLETWYSLSSYVQCMHTSIVIEHTQSNLPNLALSSTKVLPQHPDLNG